MKGKYKCGIIGFGKMGRIRAKAIIKSGYAEIISVYDPSKIVGEHPFRILNSPTEVLNSGIDAVFICTPNYLIKELTIEALDKKIHVFSEKPPGINLSETHQMQKCERGHSNVILMYGFNHRHHGSVQKMREIIEGGTMGKVLWMRGRYGKEVDDDFFKGWRVNPDLSGGGIMLDQGIHMLDLFLYLGGDFNEVKSFVSNLFWKIPGIEDNVFAIFRNSTSGICASLHSTMTQWRYIFSLELFLEKGSLILNGLKTSSGSYGDEVLTVKFNSINNKGISSKEKEFRYEEDTSWDSEINHFFECIRENKTPLLGSSSDAISLMELIEKVYKN